MSSFGKFVTQELLNDIGIVEVGIFDSKQFKKPQKKLKKFGNYQARRVSNQLSKQTTADVLEVLDNKYGILEKPLEKNTNTSEYSVFVDVMIDYANDKNNINKNRLKNSLKAVIVKPIFTSFYGRNSEKTAKIKGFNKLLIDTGQTIKAIEVRINDN